MSLTVSMTIMVASFRQSLDDWLDRMLPADVYVRAGGASDTAYLSPEAQRQIARTAGLKRVEFLRNTLLRLDPARAPVSLLARDLDRDDPAARLPLVSPTPLSPALAAQAGQPPPVWVSELVRDVYGLDPGEIVALPLAGRQTAFMVAGVWRDYARQNGALVIEREVYAELTGDETVTDAALWLNPGITAVAVEQQLRDALPGGEWLDIARPDQIRALSLRIFDRSFAATYALEAAAILIGLFGLSSSLSAQVLARRREFGMLRHLGMTRRQIGTMLTLEGLLTSAIGLLVGGALGTLLSLILIHVVNRQSFHWGMALHVPWMALGGFGLAMLALAMLTALLSARQAMGGEVVRAVREDW